MDTEKKTNEKKPSLAKNIILNTFYQLLAIITPLITTPYASRVLNSYGIGIYSYSSSLVTYFTMAAALGTVSYGTREIARLRDDKKEYSKWFWEIELLTVITSSVCLIGWGLLTYFYTEYQIYLLILSLNILATLLDISWLYAGLEKFQYTVSVNSLFKILGVVFIFLFVKEESDLWIYVLIHSGASFLGTASMWLFLPKVITKAKIQGSNLKKHFKETLVYFIPTIATTIYTVLDKTLIGVLIPGTMTVTSEAGEETIVKIADVENGYYEQATKILNLIKAVAFFSINGVMTARSSYLYGQNDMEGIKKLKKTTYHITLFLSVGAMFGLAGVSQWFVPVFFGDSYEPVINLLYVFSPIILIICISNVLEALYFTPSGNRKQSTIYLVIGSAVNLCLNCIMIPFLKALGAAIASVIAESVITVLYLVKCHGFVTMKEMWSYLWRKLIAGAVMFGCVFGLGYLLQNVIGWVWLVVIQILVGLIVYPSLLVLFRDRSIKDFVGYFKNRIKRNPDTK